MKRTFLILAFFVTGRVLSQTALSPPAPAIQPTPPPAAVAAATILSSEAATNESSATNFSLNELAGLLVNLQNSIQQTLPVLTNFNNNFDFVTLGPTTIPSGIGSTGVSFGVNLGTNVSVPTGSPSGVTNSFGLTPGLLAFPVTQQTLRALLVLQNDLERILPTLNALNGGSSPTGVGLTPGFVSGSFTNIFGVTPTSQ